MKPRARWPVPSGASVLGYELWVAPGREVKCAVAQQGAGQLQGPDPAAHAALGRAKRGAGGGETAALFAGLEGVLRVGANAPSLARAGRVAAPPPAGHPAQAVEAAGRTIYRELKALGALTELCGQASGGITPAAGGAQPGHPQHRADYCVL